MKIRPFSVLFVLAAAAGLVFASFSTHDFVQHLDRQLHDITCSWVPGVIASDSSATSGCHVTLMSPYSSVLREQVWGGLPIALPGMAVFAFLLFRGLDLVANGKGRSKAATTFLLLATAVPVLTSAVMGYLSIVELDAACRLCIGIYISSLVCFASAIGIWRDAGRPFEDGETEPDPAEEPQNPMSHHLLGVGQGVAFVAVPALLYLVGAPDFSSYLGKCGALEKPEDSYGIMVPLGAQGRGLATIEVFDPLCPACKGFEERLDMSGLGDKLSRKAVLFPLDEACNWMVKGSLHPGACTVSEAIFCAGDKAESVIDWAFENQELIRSSTAADKDAAARMVVARFPELKSCVGGAAVKNKINKSLRWAVNNQLRISTPQLFVEGTRLCDEDTDLGMDYALSRLIEQRAAGAKPGQGG
jgi:uncharacterized membrane protein